MLFGITLLCYIASLGYIFLKNNETCPTTEIYYIEKKFTNKTMELEHHKNLKNPEKKIISFGLYGNNPKYTIGAIRNVELQKQIFPDWICRFYVDKTVPDHIIKKLKEKGAEIVYMDDKNFTGSIRGMFWRFFVSTDKSVDRFIIRDSDSRLNIREKSAIDEWIASGIPVHSMRDHPNHNYAFNGGMWGGVRSKIPNLIELSKNYDWKSYRGDMDFLSKYLYPIVKNQMISHDSFHCFKWGGRPFPTRRFMKFHVGGVFDEHDNPVQSDMDLININPEACRKEKDWIYG
eukprot:gene3740-6628_t